MLDGHQLSFEAALSPGLCGLALRLQPESVGVRSADRILLRYAFGRGELVGDGQRELLWKRATRAVDDVRTEADPAHGLDAAPDSHIDDAAGDETGHYVIGLLR